MRSYGYGRCIVAPIWLLQLRFSAYAEINDAISDGTTPDYAVVQSVQWLSDPPPPAGILSGSPTQRWSRESIYKKKKQSRKKIAIRLREMQNQFVLLLLVWHFYYSIIG